MADINASGGVPVVAPCVAPGGAPYRVPGGAPGGAPLVAHASVEVWIENPLTDNFNPGTNTGQKIFLEKTKGLGADKRLSLTHPNAPKIMEFLKVKE